MIRCVTFRSGWNSDDQLEGGAIMRRKAGVLLALGASMCLFAACSTSGSATSQSTGTNSSSRGTYTIGILTDVTGPGASADASSVQGVEAGIAAARQQGYHFNYVVGDTQTTPTGALTAAQKMVEEDHVLAVVAIAGITFAAAPYLTSQGVPVVGSPQDGTEWLPSKNMFPVFGWNDPTKVATTFGNFLKMEGVTNVGTLGYGVVPLSAAAPKSYAASAESVGIKAGYVNADFAYGSTDVQPVALAMKNAGVDGVITAVEPNTGLALVTALRQDGVKLKVALMATGYGADITQGGPGAVQAAQGVDFYLVYQPIAMNTPATKNFQAAMRQIGVNTTPTFAEYQAYASVNAIVRGLEAAGPNATHASLIKGLSTVTNFDAAGLLGTHTVDFATRKLSVYGPDNCQYVTKLAGSVFQSITGAAPICGTEVPGKTIPFSSS
jgi:branched-chain amino acid transport system substrate-binding protein